jgi:hypothetical protein
VKYENVGFEFLTPKQRYYVKNREQILAERKQEYAEKTEEIKAQRRKRYRENESVRKASWVTNLRHRFGMTEEEYNEIFDRQEGCCAICGVSDCKTKTGKQRLSVDHDHSTGEIRALLCAHCNVGLGAFQDDPTIIKKAMEYLHEHRNQ